MQQGSESVASLFYDDIRKKIPNKDSPLNKTERAEYRKLVGQLNWVARHTRPDIMFDVMELSTMLNKPCVQDFKRLGKPLKSCSIRKSLLHFQILVTLVNGTF